jgi:hypothetical protein
MRILQEGSNVMKERRVGNEVTIISTKRVNSSLIATEDFNVINPYEILSNAMSSI